MKIETKKVAIRFAGLQAGDPFRFAGTLWMKLDCTIMPSGVNAVQAASGRLGIFGQEITVEKVYGSFVEADL